MYWSALSFDTRHIHIEIHYGAIFLCTFHLRLSQQICLKTFRLVLSLSSCYSIPNLNQCIFLGVFFSLQYSHMCSFMLFQLLLFVERGPNAVEAQNSASRSDHILQPDLSSRAELARSRSGL